MPITITNPEVSQPPGTNINRIFEVGQALRAHTDFVGPLSTDAFWTVQVWLTAVPERYVSFRKYPCVGSSLNTYMWQGGINDPAIDGEGLGVRPITPGAAAILRVMLDDPFAGFHEETQVPGVMAQFDPQFRVTAAATTTTGFTVDDRADLEVVKASVQVPFPILTSAGGFVLRGLAELVQQTPLSILSTAGCQTLTGEGSLTRPFGIFPVAASGMRWDFLEVPTYFGRQAGALLEFEQRIAQFELITADRDGSERTLQLLDVRSDHQFVTWGLVQLRRVEYSITPGCQVQFCWLVVA